MNTNKLEQPPASENDWQVLYQELQGKSERAAVFVGAAMLDDRLQRAIALSATEAKHRRVATYGDLAKRTNTATELGLIDASHKHDLNLIRKVRNTFAHELFTASFDDDKVVGLSQQLIYAKRFLTPDDQKSARKCFSCSVALLIYVLSIEVTKLKLSTKIEANEKANDESL